MGVGDTLASGQPMHRVFLERHCLWLVGLMPDEDLFHMPSVDGPTNRPLVGCGENPSSANQSLDTLSWHMIEDISSKNLLSMGCWEKSSIMLWLIKRKEGNPRIQL
jgi:hypothetical protein